MAVATVAVALAVAVAVAVVVVVAAVFVVVTAAVVCSWFRDEINTQNRHAICIIFRYFLIRKAFRIGAVAVLAVL